ncbi:MAG: phosphodiesterase [Paracoccaceae bacterium]
MRFRHALSVTAARRGLRRLIGGTQVLALLPALALGAYWAAGEAALAVVALGVPLLFLFTGGFDQVSGRDRGALDIATGLPLAASLEDRLDAALLSGRRSGLKTACLLIRVENFDSFTAHRGTAAGDRVLERIAQRLRGALREGDHLAWLGSAGPAVTTDQGSATFGVVLRPVINFDLEAAIQIAVRLQATAEEPVALDGAAVYLSAGVGLCLSTRSPGKTGHSMIRGAGIALDEALLGGPSAIRVYSDEMHSRRDSQAALNEDALRALENGQIVPWFQPQVSTDTGRVTGFEALARWVHPERGVVPPAQFLPILDRAGQMERLGEVILYGALKAVTAWDAAGLDVPCVAVNFTGDELRNPKLAEKIRWDLDRFDLKPGRLTVEVLETVVVGAPDDTATRNIHRLAEMGCRIDLDDFGTGHASIAALRRFAIERIKIDRSFVTHVDDDAEQQRMVSAILTMAERLGLETLAEGVETAGEHAMLAQLGCRHVQGFGIARPMPFEQTMDWIRSYEAKLAAPPVIGRRSG